MIPVHCKPVTDRKGDSLLYIVSLFELIDVFNSSQNGRIGYERETFSIKSQVHWQNRPVLRKVRF